MLLLAPPKPVLLLPAPTKISRGSRVTWSAKGRLMLKSYYMRGLPKEGVFTVEEICEWSDGRHTARLRGMKSATYVENLELAAVSRA